MTQDLFGRAVTPDLTGSVTLAMVVMNQTHKAWLLAKEGDPRPPQWVPKSRIVRGVGRDENQWTMTKVVAFDRGWL